VGWFDAAVARYSVALNGIRSIALTKLDVLDSFDPIRICTGYRSKGEVLAYPMSNISHLKHCEPVYEELPGWGATTTEIRRPEDLPGAARRYIDRLGELCGAPVEIVSVGAARDQTIWMEKGRRGLADVRHRQHQASHR